MTKTTALLTALCFTSFVQAQSNFALSFNGHSPASGTDCSTALPVAQRNYVLVPHQAALNLAGAFTIECWVNARQQDGCVGGSYYANDYFCPVSKSSWQDATQWAILVYPGTSGKISLYMGGVTLTSNLFALSTNTWYHIAITRDNAGSVNFYVNGIAMGGGTNTANASSTADMLVGRNAVTNYTYDLAGSLDELRIWNVARTASEIQANMFTELNSYTGMIACYHFNDNGASSLADATGNGHDGTLEQFASTASASSNAGSSGWLYSTAPLATGYDGPGGVGGTNGLSHLAWWLKGDAGIQLNGSTVQGWQDQSGHANNLTQATAAEQPVFQSANASLNNQASVNFDGVNTFLSYSGLAGGMSSYHSFYVFRTGNSFNTTDGFTGLHSHDNWSPGYVHSQIMASSGVWQHAVNNSPSFAQSTSSFSLNTSYAVSLRSDATVQMRFFNGSAEANTAAYSGSQYLGPGTLGAWNNAGSYERKANLQWGELILFDRALNRAQENLVYNYLSAKYQLALNSGNYFGGSGSYTHNLVGIGNGTDGAQGVAKGGGLVLNNYGLLNDDGDYLLAAHNNAKGGTSVSGISGVNYRYNRLWFVTKTDAAGTTGGSLGMSFDLGTIGNITTPGAVSNYALLYSPDAINFSKVSPKAAAFLNGNNLQFTLDAASLNNGYYTVGASTASLLPLTLLSFEAAPVPNGALLTWKTVSETGVDHFELQHGIQTGEFRTLARLEAQNTPTASYAYTHPHPSPGIHYYRLLMVDKSGKQTYSGIKTLQVTAPSSLQYFPSPFRDHFTVKTQEGEAIISLEVFDASGKKRSSQVRKTTNMAWVTLTDPCPGLYFFTLVTTRATYREKIMELPQ